MSVQEQNLSLSCDSPFSLESIPQVSLFLNDRNNTSSTEVSTPLLKKSRRAKPSLWVESKRSPFVENLTTFEQDSANERLLDAHLSSLTQTPLVPLELCSPYGSSSCGDESPLEIKLRRISPVSVCGNKFTPEFYERIEEFMDAQDLHISHPDEYTNKRAFISKLRVLTQRSFGGISSNQSEGEDDNSQSGTTFSEFDSPSTISPSIQTSSLLIRRTLSKDSPVDTTYKKSKFALHKSPFFVNCQTKMETDENNLTDSNNKNIEKHTPTFTPIKIFNEEDILDKVSPTKSSIISDLNMKLRGLAFEENREFSEPSSATSLRILELSPRKN